MENNETKKYFLQPLSKDERDFSHSRVFGIPALSELPTGDFFVSTPLEIKNQDINYLSDFCASYGATSVSEDEDQVEEVPEWTFAKAKQILAKDKTTESDIQQIIGTFGLNLRDICNAAVTYGFLERQYDPFKCETIERPARDYVADWRNWPADLDALGYEHQKLTYFSVDGPYDIFDNFRANMWQNREERRSILTGALWRQSWSNAQNAVIKKDTYDPNEAGGGHAFKIFGQAVRGNELCLVAQLSDGKNWGDEGMYYFTRDVVNREFDTYGAFTLKMMPKGTAQVHNEYNYSVNAGIIQKIWKIIVYILKTYLKINI